ncbi:predicted protein [Verticillium alfalfae VaMs.102]|uniref:Predicted protein n=1 Tax=Verticillium alfalfae (strain VaMs.102 / ATCC MYA-4576 / FGSC 10136) TaxID=526221 RepID=C9SSR7_VERA1|nr:predicted protein [Verticillium alfalfae VaMs.102]EEY21832.1 predicted protein [Verticillium alfalfae VaMs.102]
MSHLALLSSPRRRIVHGCLLDSWTNRAPTPHPTSPVRLPEAVNAMSLLGRRALEILNARNTLPLLIKGETSHFCLFYWGRQTGRGWRNLVNAVILPCYSSPYRHPHLRPPESQDANKGRKEIKVQNWLLHPLPALSLSLSAIPTKSLKQIQRENCRPTIRGKEGPSTISPWEPAQGGDAGVWRRQQKCSWAEVLPNLRDFEIHARPPKQCHAEVATPT